MNLRPTTTMVPRTLARLWSFFVVGIFIITIIFGILTWREIKQATAYRLSILATAVAKIEDLYTHNIAVQMRQLAGRLVHTPPQNQNRILRHYLEHHPNCQTLSILNPKAQIMVRAGTLPPPSAQTTNTLMTLIRHCHTKLRMCLSSRIFIPTGTQTVFIRPLLNGDFLIMVKPHDKWPQLNTLLQHLPKAFHIFVLNPRGTLEYRVPRPKNGYPTLRRSGVLIRQALHHPNQPSGSFFGPTSRHQEWRLGAYQRTPDGLLIGVSLPAQALIVTLVHRLEVPLILVLILVITTTIYYRYAQANIAHVTALQEITDNRIREERAFAEQQRDFYLTLSELNQFIVRHPEPDRLFAEICRISVAYTGLLFAWAGWIEPSADIRVIAVAEKHPLGINWHEKSFSADSLRANGHGPAGLAARSGRIEIVDDVAHDPRMEPWRDLHTRIGTGAAAAIPIVVHGQTIAIVAFGSEQTGFFVPSLVRLLEELAQDTAFSLEDHAREQRLKYQAGHDALTGLDNRTLFRDHVAQSAENTSQDGAFAVAILDLDGFKTVNDQFGHSIGDELLQRVAERLQTLTPPGTTIARLGGDEFGLAFHATDDLKQLTDILKKIQNGLDAPFAIGTYQSLHVAASIGISLFPTHGRQVDDLIRHADLALYEAKNLGKNAFHFYSNALEERLFARHKLHSDFTQALHGHDLILYYQPQIDIATGQVRSLEGLLRWQQNDGRVRVPSEYFYAIVQDNNLMRNLNLFVIKQAIATLGDLAKEGVHLPIAVNIHSHHLLHPDFLKDLRDLVHSHEDLIHYLELEITETSELFDLTGASETLRECQKLGLSISLDDFGTGYASLNYLQQLPCNTIKIDMSFVANMGDDPRDFAIVSGILATARLLDIPVVAEGIERTEQGLLLRDLGCRYAQGYAISRPMPQSTIVNWLTNWLAPALWTETPPALTRHKALWLARARHRASLSRLQTAIRTASSPADLVLDPSHCHLHHWITRFGGMASQDMITLHTHVHEHMTHCLSESTTKIGVLVSTLTALQQSEEALDAIIMDLLIHRGNITLPES